MNNLNHNECLQMIRQDKLERGNTPSFGVILQERESLERENAQMRAAIEQQKETIEVETAFNNDSIKKHLQQVALIESMATTIGMIRLLFPSNSGMTAALLCDEALEKYREWKAKP